jgi:MinD superfamily P-loop ATPase
MKRITIVSGKGGVGKSSITASIALLLAKNNKLVAVDCDVDTPNLGIVLGVEKFDKKERISTNEKAELVSMKGIDNYKKVINSCNFSAISWDDKNKKLIFNKFLCEGCGSCQLIYPNNIILKKVYNGFINKGITNYGFPIISGELKMGETGSGKIVSEVKSVAEDVAKKEKASIIITDSSPGIGCSVIASVKGSDFVVAITEPTNVALNDLKRVLQVVKHFKIPYGLIINKWDLSKDFSKKIELFAKEQKIPILGKIPYDEQFVNALVNLKPIIIFDNKFEKVFIEIIKKISDIK